MLRIPPGSDTQLASEVQRLARDWEALGSDSTFVRTLGRRPEYLRDFMRFHLAVRNEGILDARLKELVRLKIASLNACRY